MNLSEYKFEIMLIVIVLVLALFWFAINFFDKNKPNHEFSPMNDNKVHMNGQGAYTVEKFQNNSPNNKNVPTVPPLPVNTPMTPPNNNTAPLAPPANNTQSNELVALSNNTVADFNSLSLDQLSQLKSQTRAHGVLGLVTYDAPSDTLRIVSTKA